MFLTELFPVAQKLLQQPIAFTSGFCSGLLRLDLDQAPLSDWLAKQGYNPREITRQESNSNNGDGPQSISIE